jgi:Mg2+ and Co2+ transporter CorA
MQTLTPEDRYLQQKQLFRLVSHPVWEDVLKPYLQERIQARLPSLRELNTDAIKIARLQGEQDAFSSLIAWIEREASHIQHSHTKDRD